jgi:DNA polymerase III subunit delta
MAPRKNELDIDDIITNLKNKIYHPVYLLHGEEPYFIDAISDYIEQNVLSDLEKEFNQTIVYGKDVDIPTLVSYARRFPMMANYQVIIVKEAQDLDKIEDSAPYFESPLDSTILVLCWKYEKVDRRKTVFKTIEKTGIVFESAKLYDDKIPHWIFEYLKARNYTISLKAAVLLTEFIGNDLSKIVNEISKLIINVPAGQEITEEYVERNIGISKDFNVFELQKALGKKDVLKSNQIILHFAGNPRENPLVKVIPMLYGFFSKVLLYHYLPDKSKNTAAAALSVNPFFLPDFQLAARNYPVSKLVSVISTLRDFDLKSKGVDSNNTSVTDGELMKELVFRILH